MVDVTVSSPTQLLAALSNASGETTIRLLPGNYGFLNLQNMKFPAEVTIASADPGNPATFDRVQLLNVKQLAFDSIEFAYDSSPGASVDKVYFLIEDCKKIAIRNATFIGDLAEGVGNASDGYGAGIGLCVIDSKKITVEGNQFLDWWIAAQFLRSDKLTVKDNDIHDVRNDGLTFAEVNDVVIEGNHIHDFRVSPTSGDHPDMIQFWTAGSKAPSSEITIRGNTLDSGSGSETQSIFMGNEKASKGISMYYRDVLIEGNHINNSDWFGIYVGESIGTKIHDNVLTFNPAGGSSGRLDVPTIQISEDSKTTTVTANEVTGMDLRGGDKADVLEGGFGEDKLAGGDGKDVLLGDANDDVVKGGSGKDRVFGGSDSDRVKGGAGNDELDGGPGSDDLVGGAGGDLFVFSAADHSPAGDPDRILDFNRKEGDRIDLSDLDGNTSKAGDQDLVFIGSKAFDAYDREDAGSKGLVRFSDGRLTADVNGDNIADFEVSLGKANLHHGDLLL